ncbi:chorismate mutase [Clostridium thermarum]|uniref:chorismate mutase n=1 Tax=Clostridium thermarum TaxID=1716543 RepID=UPI0013D6EE16|nr:chorismate mutase [Clostridium thermarum]
MDELKAYRDEIDAIDKEVVKLIEKRLEICLKVGQFKKERDLPILNEDREQHVLQNNLSLVENKYYEIYIRNILQTIMDESKKLQASF